MAFHLGTSGYAYDEWKGVFYPSDLKKKDQLRYFASRFDSVEINYTFRRYPTEKTLDAWVEQTPPGFLFTLKANQQITHWRRLADAAEPVERFMSLARRLGDRLGVILFQCPPNLVFDREVTSTFLDLLPDGARYAMELRHPSWEDARDLLRERGVGWCTADTDVQPATVDSWEPFGYLRMRREVYSEEDLAAWAGRIRAALADGRDVYCYFKHEDKTAGPGSAVRLGELLDRGTASAEAGSAEPAGRPVPRNGRPDATTSGGR
jgi:uncharacterized protein YecE (DUF72 family)